MAKRYCIPFIVCVALNLTRFAGAEQLRITNEASGMVVQGGERTVIYVVPPVGFDVNRPPGYWPYAFPQIPQPHPAFPTYPVYPSYSSPAPYVPPGSPYAPPPLEVRAME